MHYYFQIESENRFLNNEILITILLTPEALIYESNPKITYFLNPKLQPVFHKSLDKSRKFTNWIPQTPY